MFRQILELILDYIPLRSLRMAVLVCGLVALLMLAGAFYLGERAAYSGMRLDPDLYRAMQKEIPRLRARLETLQVDAEVQRTRASVDQSALEMVRKDMAAQEEQIASLEEGLRFYRSLMAPGEIAQGLSLRPLELVSTDEAGRIAFRIVAQQEARKHDLLGGDLTAEVLGTKDGAEISYPLSELSEDIEKDPIALRFRYFQSIDGTLVLPDGFEPRWVHVLATARSPHKAQVEERFPWRVRARFTSVGS